MSKELEALKHLLNIYAEDCNNNVDNIKKTYRITIGIIEKSLKALEIIKEKGVNVGNFIFYQSIKKVDDIVLPRETIFDLCSGDCQNGHLSKEEYDLLKEVLLCQ